MSKLDELERRWNACNGKAFHFDDQNFMSYLWTEVPSLLACARLVREIAGRDPGETFPMSLPDRARRAIAELEVE